MNNHYVTKCVIEQWCSSDFKDVFIFNFTQKKTYHDFPVNVFSNNDFLTPEEDNRYSKLFETGLGRFIKSHTKTNYRVIKSKSVERSVRLYMYFQIERLTKLKDNKQLTISILNDEELDKFLSADKEKFKLVGLNLENDFVVLPEIGMFPLIWEDNKTKKMVTLFCFPLTPHFILIKQSNEYQIRYSKIPKSIISISSYGTALTYDSMILPYEFTSTKEEDILKIGMEAISINRSIISSANQN